MIRVFRPPSFLLLSVQIFGVAQQAVVSSIAVCSSHKLLRKQVLHSSGGVLGGACLVSSCGPLVRSLQSGDLE